MKKIISMTAAVIFTVVVFAQTTNTESKMPKTAAKYCCTNSKCNHCSSEAGVCSHHKTSYVKEGMYYCPMHTDATSENAAKCSKCGMDMVKMEVKEKKKQKH